MLAITIDTGTTNTRVAIWRDGRVVSRSSAEVGVRDTALTGDKQKLQAGIRDQILKAATIAGVDFSSIGVILASGMITSNIGLFEVPHISAPAGIQELAAALVQSRIAEVASRPIWFVPGIKNSVPVVDMETYESMDIMRGEEVEAFGLVERKNLQGPATFIFPGSHSKFITMDANNRITACVTTLAGELLNVITGNTILASAVDNSFAHELDEIMLLEGARCCAHVGLGRACFSVRILEQFGGTTTKQRANFLLGAVLEQDVYALKQSSAIRLRPEIPVVITGKKVMKEAFAALIKNDHFFQGEIVVADDDQTCDLAGLGAMAVARERGLMIELPSKAGSGL
jgi:2-dehydro-3-deoxygalactonokinase